MTSALKRKYWEANEVSSRWKKVLFGHDKSFRNIVVRENLKSPRKISPVVDDVSRRADLAVRWLLAAQEQTPDDGVSYGYFPVSDSNGWDVSYPETTGYIITTLLEYGARTTDQDIVERAVRMGQWEADIQMSNGAVQGGKVAPKDKQSPAAFNTGMVLDGWVSILNVRSDDDIAVAAERAGDFLVTDMTDDGLFATNGLFVSADTIKIYNVLCAWAMYRLGEVLNESRFKNAAIRAVEGALKHQLANGWFQNNCLTEKLRPLTHTIGYTAQGVLEVGIAANRDDFIDSAQRCLDGVLPNVHNNGYLSGRFDERWKPQRSWVCLTGSAQLAIVAYRLAGVRNNPSLETAADRLVNFLKAVQRIDCDIAGVNGALAGSYPVSGPYMTTGYPNWATKYFVDALMLQADHVGAKLERHAI
ncbi:MAG: hypothetical protein ACI915_002017 [Gammaproteobacteria bacterium]